MTEPENTPNPGTSSHPSRSSAKVEGGSGGSKLLPILLGLLLLLLLVGLLLFFLLNDDDDEDVSLTPTDTPSVSEPATPTLEPSIAPVPGDTGSPIEIPDPSQSPIVTEVPGTGDTLLADGQDVVAAAGSNELAPLIGTSVSGFATVQEVAADEGFWVGSSPEQRVYVFLTDEARGGGGESVADVTEGDTVSITGTIASAEEQAEIVARAEGEGLAQLQRQGALILATGYSVT